MKRAGIALVLALAATSASALAVELPPDLARAVSDFDHAQFDNDITTLERLIADDYVLVNSDASVETKAQSIADFSVPGFKVEPYVMEDQVAIVWKDGAVLGGVVHLSWTQDGKHQTRLLRLAYVWANRGGRWQTTYTQVTRVLQ